LLPQADYWPFSVFESFAQSMIIFCVIASLSTATAETPCFHSHSLLELFAPVPFGVLILQSGAAISKPN
jgi:hypothetical protein